MKDTKCFICKQRDIQSVMQRVKGHGYTHQSCIDLTIAVTQKLLRVTSFSDIQEYAYDRSDNI